MREHAPRVGEAWIGGRKPPHMRAPAACALAPTSSSPLLPQSRPAAPKAKPAAAARKKPAPLGPSAAANASPSPSPAPKAAARKPAKAAPAVEDVYQKKTQLEHILLRPDTYVGSTERQTARLWAHDGGATGLAVRDVSYVPGLYKIFDEILVNAADNKVREEGRRERRARARSCGAPANPPLLSTPRSGTRPWTSCAWTSTRPPAPCPCGTTGRASRSSCTPTKKCTCPNSSLGTSSPRPTMTMPKKRYQRGRHGGREGGRPVGAKKRAPPHRPTPSPGPSFRSPAAATGTAPSWPTFSRPGSSSRRPTAPGARRIRRLSKTTWA